MAPSPIHIPSKRAFCAIVWSAQIRRSCARSALGNAHTKMFHNGAVSWRPDRRPMTPWNGVGSKIDPMGRKPWSWQSRQGKSQRWITSETRVAVTDQAPVSEAVIVACFVAKNALASKKLCGRVETYEFFYKRLMTQQKNLMRPTMFSCRLNNVVCCLTPSVAYRHKA